MTPMRAYPPVREMTREERAVQRARVEGTVLTGHLDRLRKGHSRAYALAELSAMGDHRR